MAKRQGIEIAKTISRKPRYVSFDEPKASLGEAEAVRIIEQVRVLRFTDIIDALWFRRSASCRS